MGSNPERRTVRLRHRWRFAGERTRYSDLLLARILRQAKGARMLTSSVGGELDDLVRPAERHEYSDVADCPRGSAEGIVARRRGEFQYTRWRPGLTPWRDGVRVCSQRPGS